MITALLVTCASTFVESVPFILAAALLVRVPLRWSSRMVPYLGCGCGSGPSARSVPAAIATALFFGPLVAGVRLAAAIAVDRLASPEDSCPRPDDSVLEQFSALTPLAILASLATIFAPMFARFARVPALEAFAAAALLGFVAAPCGIGAAALAAPLRAVHPAAAAGFLCIAGIFDVRTWLRSMHVDPQHDTLGYAMTALACGIVAAHAGAGLVNPRIAATLWACAVGCVGLAYKHRTHRHGRLRIAPAVMLAGAVLSAPPPQYHATETSLADMFAGEAIDFTGVVTQTGEVTTLVRYAITCCRADAAPIVIRLAHRTPALHGWAHASGTLVQSPDGLLLRTGSLRTVSPPIDPFVYR